ncbi:hypothetical protein [Labilibaculum euxinus]
MNARNVLLGDIPLLITSLEETIPLGPTLGEVDTILLLAEPVWGAKYLLPGVIRLSVGIENIEKLKGWIGEALGKM